jgi:hypothetical protein
LLVGATPAMRTGTAWLQVYRAINHGHAKAVSRDLSSLSVFGPRIKAFAVLFVNLQDGRHDADYNPAARFFKSATVADVNQAEAAIAGFLAAPAAERRDFCVRVLFRQR